MTITRRVLRLELAAALVLIATSCVPEFKNPLPPPADGKADETILGVWETPPGEGNDRQQISIFANKSGGLDVICIADIDSDEGLSVSVFRGHTTRIGEDKFLSLTPRKPEKREPLDDPEKRTFLIAPYETSAESLVVKVFSLSTFRHMIEQGELDGEIRDRTHLDSVIVTASSEELAAAIARKGAAALIDEDSVLKYRKLHQPDRRKNATEQRAKQRR
ncbi:MAG: hypothetical protein JW741_29670 [Sedimentisphaerales bacterium]|nr:hypothetical protein [Sedimentisphaerales bacterium]